MNYVIYQSFSWMMPLPIRIKANHITCDTSSLLTITHYKFEFSEITIFGMHLIFYKERNPGRTAIMFIAYM